MSIIRCLLVLVTIIHSTIQNGDIVVMPSIRLDNNLAHFQNIIENPNDQILLCNKINFHKTMTIYTCEGYYYNIFIIIESKKYDKDYDFDINSNDKIHIINSRFIISSNNNQHIIMLKNDIHNAVQNPDTKLRSTIKNVINRYSKTYTPTQLRFENIRFTSFLQAKYRSMYDETLIGLLKYEYKHPAYNELFVNQDDTVVNYIFTKLQIILFVIVIYILEMM